MKDRRPLKRVRTPREWLGYLAASHKRSQRSIATELRRDASQVNKWFSGKEPIPQAMFLAAAAAIDSKFGEEAARVWIVHEMAVAVAADARRQLIDVSEATADSAAAALIRRAEASALEFGSDTDPECYSHLSRYVFDAHAVLRLIGACQSRESAFISRGNIHDHLRFPFNVMTGDLMSHPFGMRSEQQAIISRLSSSMKSTAVVKDSDIRSAYCRQHAFYMLSRYGRANDAAFAEELMGRATDLHTKRTARYARIINATDPAAADEFVYELSHDRRFTQITLDFDFVHYGDKQLTSVHADGNVSETVRNYLRRARQRTAAGQLCLHKLHCILLERGVSPFQTPAVMARLRAVVGAIYDLEPQRRTLIEKQFVRVFGDLAVVEKAYQLELLAR
jgi:hypothetical protein